MYKPSGGHLIYSCATGTCPTNVDACPQDYTLTLSSAGYGTHTFVVSKLGLTWVHTDFDNDIEVQCVAGYWTIIGNVLDQLGATSSFEFRALANNNCPGGLTYVLISQGPNLGNDLTATLT